MHARTHACTYAHCLTVGPPSLFPVWLSSLAGAVAPAAFAGSKRVLLKPPYHSITSAGCAMGTRYKSNAEVMPVAVGGGEGADVVCVRVCVCVCVFALCVVCVCCVCSV